MSSPAYLGTQNRTFPAAMRYLLENEYRLLGSRRVLELLSHDVQQLIEQFYPRPERLAPGWMVFTGTKAQGGKPMRGQTAADLPLVTIAWPVILPEDIAIMATHPDSLKKRNRLAQTRLVRLIEYGWSHPDGPVLLTLADLSLLIGVTTEKASKLVADARSETRKSLWTKASYSDQGAKPTHKDQIIALYEQGMDEADIAQATRHHITSVGHYIRDYQRLKLMLQRGGNDHASMMRLLDMRPAVFKAHLALLHQFHPDLFDITPSRSSEI